MKCRACDEILTDKEATRKNKYKEFVDMCGICFPFEPMILDEDDLILSAEVEEADDTED